MKKAALRGLDKSELGPKDLGCLAFRRVGSEGGLEGQRQLSLTAKCQNLKIPGQ